MFSVSGYTTSPSRARAAAAIVMLVVLPIVSLVIALPWDVAFAAIAALAILAVAAGVLVHTARTR